MSDMTRIKILTILIKACDGKKSKILSELTLMIQAILSESSVDSSEALREVSKFFSDRADELDKLYKRN